MRQDNGTLIMQTSKSLVIASPRDLVDLEAGICSFAGHAFPTLRFGGRLSAELLLLPHDYETIFGSATDDSTSLVELDRNDLIINYLAFESRVG